MQSLFRSALGVKFRQLAPVLRRHYDVGVDQEVTVQGRMETWNRYPLLRALIPLAPLNAKDVEVVVKNRGLLNKQNQMCLEWRRTFYFSQGVHETYTLTRPMHLMSRLAGEGRDGSFVLDLFNQPASIGVTLELEVIDDGNALKQTSRGSQFAVVGERLIALPRLIHVNTVAVERAIDDDTVHTDVTVSHSLLGRLFGYRGRLKVLT
jgi:hypothetical protein